MPSIRRVSFSNQNVEITEIARYHADVESAVRTFYGAITQGTGERFIGYTAAELEKEL